MLSHQLKVLRRGGTRPRFTDADRAFLAAAAGFLSRDRWRSFLVGPDTLLRWHRELSRRRPGRRSRRPGRPPLDPSIKSLILRLGRENPRWGYLRIRGELLKLGVDVSATTIATVLRRSGLGPAPRRIGPTWTQFLRLQAYGPAVPRRAVRGERGPRGARGDPPPAAQRRPRHGRRTHPCRPVGPNGHLTPTVGPLPRCVRDAGSVARRNSGSRRARDRRLNLSVERKGRQPPIGLSLPCPVMSTGRAPRSDDESDPALARGE